MATSRLELYNRALTMAGERTIETLTEEGEARRLLDNAWADGRAVDLCLEEAQWYFGMRTRRIDYDPDVEPQFGFSRAFSKPDDWILTSGICEDEFFRVPLKRYFDEAGYWYSDLDSIYVRHVSNDANYGGDLGKWPATFSEFVAAHLCGQIILKLSSDESRWRMFINPENPLHSVRGRALMHAKSKCAMTGPTQFLAQGNWSKSRMRGSSRHDGGNPNSLYG